jgi:hypothetical protein
MELAFLAIYFCSQPAELSAAKARGLGTLVVKYRVTMFRAVFPLHAISSTVRSLSPKFDSKRLRLTPARPDIRH